MFEVRGRALAQLRSRIERALATEHIGAALEHFRGWRPTTDESPIPEECLGCAALRVAMARVVAVAARWPELRPKKEERIGSLLAAADQRETLVDMLCAVEPASGGREEIERRFRYYSWTASGARLLAVAALFERPDVVAGCHR